MLAINLKMYSSSATPICMRPPRLIYCLDFYLLKELFTLTWPATSRRFDEI